MRRGAAPQLLSLSSLDRIACVSPCNFAVIGVAGRTMRQEWGGVGRTSTSGKGKVDKQKWQTRLAHLIPASQGASSDDMLPAMLALLPRAWLLGSAAGEGGWLAGWLGE